MQGSPGWGQETRGVRRSLCLDHLPGQRVPGAACLCTVTAAEGPAVSRGSGPGDLQLLLRLGAPGASD